MSIVVNEKIGSRTLQRSALSAPTARRVFDVYETDTSTDKSLTAMVALRSEGVPELGDSHPEDRQMSVVSYEITANTGSDYLQTITCNYAVTGLDGGGSYTALSTGVRGLFVDTWRNFPIAPPVNLQGVSEPDPSIGGIGGTKIDQAGKPISIAIFQQTLDIRSPFADEPPFDIIRQLTNTRNATDWQEFPVGSLLYLGAQASVTNGNIWTTTHKFAADEIFHCRQLAMRDADGKPTLDVNKQAEDVRWVQKFPNLTNFDALNIGSTP